MLEHIDYVEDVAKLIRHVAWTDSSQVRAKHAQINLHIYGPQVGFAANTCCMEPHSMVLKENLEMFCKMWQFLVDDVIQISKQVADQTHQLHGRRPSNRRSSPSQQQIPAVIISGSDGDLVEGGPSTADRHNRQPPPILKKSTSPNNLSMVPPHHYSDRVGFSNDIIQRDDVRSFDESNGFNMGKFHRGSAPDISSLQQQHLHHHQVGNGGDVGRPTSRPDILGPGPPLGPPQHQQQGGMGNYLDPRMAFSQHNAPYDHHLMNGMDPSRRHSTSDVVGGCNQYHRYPVRRSSSFIRPEEILDTYTDVENNEIIKRAKKMAVQSEDMTNFTRGYGKVKTTQDLFTLAEYFAEETNIIYKVIRLFSYDVPAGEDKRSLMAIADEVPKHCHQISMLIQIPIVGKAAIFTKVDSIVKEARQIVHLLVRVIEICFQNAKKYNLDFRNVTSQGRNPPQTEGGTDFSTDASEAASFGGRSRAPSANRQGQDGNKRTRVSFIMGAY